MPSNHKDPMNTTSSSTNVGGESFSRLSRWFSIRRSSYYQYDLGGRGGSGGGGGGIGGGNGNASLDKLGAGGNNCDTIKEHNGTNTTTKNGRNGSRTDASLFRYNSNSSDKCEDFTYASAAELEECDGDTSMRLPSMATLGRQTPPCLPAPPTGLTEQQIKRRHIVAAIVHSENSYVATLQRLVNNYKKSLEESNPSILNPSKISTLFYRLPEILQIHTLFRIALTDYVRNWDKNESLGDVFIATFSKPVVLEHYSGFINNFSAAMELAKMETKRKSALADFFNVKQISNHDRLSFFGLMVKPVQRFPQFILFLQDLLKHTSKEHHDRVSLQLALTQLESLAEMLNECKREAEQHQAFKDMLANISGTFNIRSLLLPSLDNSSCSPKNVRHLLRQDNMQQMEFNQSGFIFKVKQRRLLLLNDRIICVSGGTKQPYEFAGTTEKLRFKWMYPLNEVEIVDNSTSTTLSRILTAGGAQRRESIVSMNGSQHSFDSSTTTTHTSTMTSSTSAATAANNSADNLCSEMANLMADYEIVSRINDMVMNLKSHYDELNPEVTKRVLNSIQRSIQEKDEEMFWVDSCCLQLVVKNKSGNKETFTFQTESPNVKKEWVTELRLAQLALDSNNSPAWDVPESEINQPLIRMPLFVKAQTIFKSQYPTEARCGCYFTQSPLDDVQSTMRQQPFKKRTKQNYIWICSNDDSNTFVTILLQNQQQANLLKTCETFTLAKQQVTAVEFVRAKIIHEDRYVSITTDTIWLATQSKQILVYSTRVGEKNREMARISVPDPVTFVLFHMNNVFVSLTSGKILIFRNLGADFGGIVNIGAATIDLNAYEVINLNKEYPITSLIPINENVYAACGKHVWIFNGTNGELLKTHEIPNHNNDTTVTPSTINLMAHSGVGLWISLKNSSVICLYHTETFRHLQDLNIASNVLRVTSFKKDTAKSGNSTVVVTALMACSGLLWVGTNVGIALTIPLPRLEGVPIIKVGITISYHSHFGPIKFFLPLTTAKATATSTLKASASFKKTVKIACDSPGKSSREKLNVSRQESLVEQSIQEGQPLTNSENALQTMAPPKRKTLDILNSPLLGDRKSMKNFFSQLSANSSKTLPSGFSRKSSTLSASMRSTGSSSLNSEHGTCDVYGLYRDLIYVKEDYNEETRTGNLLNSSFECLRKSDPELSSITAKISTLDRRLKMKTSRPRSLDLSNWSVGSHSSSSHSYLYSSSGSDDNMSLRLLNNNNNNNNNNNHSKSVSRSNSNASQKIIDSELMDISETATTISTSSTSASSIRQTMPILLQRQSTINDYDISSASGTYTKLKKNKKTANGYEDANAAAANNRKTIITLMGGRGYINWRHIWYNSSADFQASPNTSPSISAATGAGITGKHQRNSSMSTMFTNLPNSNDAHILIWEKKL